MVVNGRKIDHNVRSFVFLEPEDEDWSKLVIQLGGGGCYSNLGEFYGDIECYKKARVYTETAKKNRLLIEVDVALWGNDSCTLRYSWEPDF